MGTVITPTHTPEYIRYLFNYDPLNGVLTRAISYGVVNAGDVVGGEKVAVHGRHYIVARICWCHYYGEWPPNDMHVDHRNRRHGINAIDNLRLATPTQNQQNKAGCGQYPKGVTWRNRLVRPWQAKIRYGGVRHHLGSFKTMAAAMIAYREACIEHHGEYACYE